MRLNELEDFLFFFELSPFVFSNEFFIVVLYWNISMSSVKDHFFEKFPFDPKREVKEKQNKRISVSAMAKNLISIRIL